MRCEQNPLTRMMNRPTTDRQSTQSHPVVPRPKSCYSELPSAFRVSTNTTTTNYKSYSDGVTNAGLQYPQTAAFAASSTQTTISPQHPGNNTGSLPQTNFSPAATNTRQWAAGGKVTSISDSKSAPRRGRGLLQSQLSGGVIPFCGYCNQPIRYESSVDPTAGVNRILPFQWPVHHGTEQDLVSEPLRLCQRPVQAVARAAWIRGGTGSPVLRDLLRDPLCADLFQVQPTNQRGNRVLRLAIDRI